MRESTDPVSKAVANSESADKVLSRCKRILGVSPDQEISTKDKCYSRICDNWKATVDGGDMCEVFQNEKGYSWASGYMSCVSGRQFVRFTQLKAGRLSTLENANRGREVDKKCRGCLKEKLPNPRVETLGHVLTACPATHGLRIQRHDGVAKLIQEQAEAAGWKVIWEPRLYTSLGLRKPDLLIYNDNQSCIVDVTIVGERYQNGNVTTGVNDHYVKKIERYSEDAVLDKAEALVGSRPKVFPLVLTVRGIWLSSNNNLLKFLKISKCKSIIELRALEGSVRVWSTFGKIN